MFVVQYLCFNKKHNFVNILIDVKVGLCILIIFLTYSDLQALAKFQTTTKLTTKSGIEQEESLLTESAARETSLQTEIIELENETKQVCNLLFEKL